MVTERGGLNESLSKPWIVAMVEAAERLTSQSSHHDYFFNALLV